MMDGDERGGRRIVNGANRRLQTGGYIVDGGREPRRVSGHRLVMKAVTSNGSSKLSMRTNDAENSEIERLTARKGK
jgi:hypothetical protein